MRPQRPRDSFPPYQLGDQTIVGQAQARTTTLSRIYHKSHEQAWDGRKTLDGLVEKHGGIHMPEDKKEAFGKIASVLLWGELAAWSISADIALKLQGTPEKMAASSQVFDEARHFYVLRDYLWRAGIDVPPLGGFSRALLVSLLETENLVYKLVGMQLLVENTAVCLFKMIAEANIEPVLTDLLYFFEKDEARHVGLGALTLPKILADLNDYEAAKLWAFQLRCQLTMLAGGLTMREHFETLDIDQSAMQRHAFKLHAEVYRRMRKEQAKDTGVKGPRATRGLFRMSKDGQGRINTFLWPKVPPEEVPKWQTFALKTIIGAAKRSDRWLARRAPRT
jgi:hypothetical protein